MGGWQYGSLRRNEAFPVSEFPPAYASVGGIIMPGGRRSSQKGKRGEREVADLCQGLTVCPFCGRPMQLEGKRVPGSGAYPGYEGDVTATLTTSDGTSQHLLLQVKRQECIGDRYYNWLEGHDLLFMRKNRRPWLVVAKVRDDDS